MDELSGPDQPLPMYPGMPAPTAPGYGPPAGPGYGPPAGPPPFGPAPAGPGFGPPTGPGVPSGRRRSWLTYGVVAGAFVVAGAGFAVGHITAGGRVATSASGSSAAAAATAADLSAFSDATPAPNTCTPKRQGVAGTLKSVNGSTLTVTDAKNQTVTVNTTSSTKITKVVSAGVGDVSNGAEVAVRGMPGATGSPLAASLIEILPGPLPATGPQGKPLPKGPGRPGRPGAAVGMVSGVSNGTFTVTEPDGTKVAVTTSPATVVHKTQTAAVSDLTLNQPILVAGMANSDGSVTAASIVQGSPGFGFGPFGGGRPRVR